MTTLLLPSARLAMGAALLLGVSGRGDALVFVGPGFGFPYCPSPPAYCDPGPVGAPCYCPDAYGRVFPGRIG